MTMPPRLGGDALWEAQLEGRLRQLHAGSPALLSAASTAPARGAAEGAALAQNFDVTEFMDVKTIRGEIDKVLQALPKQTPLQVLEKYRLNFKINEECDATQMNGYSESIQRFLHYLKKAIGVMQMQKR